MSDKKRKLKLKDLLDPGPSKVQKIHKHDEQQPDIVNNSKSSNETEYSGNYVTRLFTSSSL
jgi:hypothetical protein